jgi:hypothetical protein
MTFLTPAQLSVLEDLLAADYNVVDTYLGDNDVMVVKILIDEGLTLTWFYTADGSAVSA